MRNLKDWLNDWVFGWAGPPDEGTEDSPLSLYGKVLAAIGGLVAAVSSPAITLLVPKLNTNGALILRITIALIALYCANRIVTDRKTITITNILQHRTVTLYKYSSMERNIARLVVLFGFAIWLLNFVPATSQPKDCLMNAVITPPKVSNDLGAPAVVSVAAKNFETPYPVQNGNMVAILVPGEYLNQWSVSLVWTDGSRRKFRSFFGCLAVSDTTEDGFKIDLIPR